MVVGVVRVSHQFVRLECCICLPIHIPIHHRSITLGWCHSSHNAKVRARHEASYNHLPHLFRRSLDANWTPSAGKLPNQVHLPIVTQPMPCKCVCVLDCQLEQNVTHLTQAKLRMSIHSSFAW